MEEKKECFVIMPISDSEGYEKGHFKKVYDSIIKPSIIKAGFEPYRADDSQSSRFIHMDILKKLIEAPMAICDLTTRNPNVLYELGIRQAFNKPVFLIQEEGTERIFDISGISTKDYKKGFEYEDVIKTHQEFSDGIIETFNNDTEINSLVSLMNVSPAQLPSKTDLRTLSNERVNKVMLNQILEINRKIDNIESQYRSRELESKIIDENYNLKDKFLKAFDADKRFLDDESPKKFYILEDFFDENPKEIIIDDKPNKKNINVKTKRGAKLIEENLQK